MNWTLTVPTKLESAVTGYFGKAEYQHRGVEWCIECRAGPNNLIQPIITRRGETITWEAAPTHAKKAARSAFAILVNAA